MKTTFKMQRIISSPILLLLLISLSVNICAQEKKSSIHHRDSLISLANEYMETVRYCALITVDSAGQPHARTMDSFLPDENMKVYLGTNRNSRKVQEISNNPRVTLYYADESGVGYLSIMGTAILVDDPEAKAIWWKEEWEEYYKNREESYILIKVIPDKLEMVNYEHNIIGDTITWAAPCVEFNDSETKKKLK